VWGELAGAAQLRGRPRPQNDMWIAACCLRYQVPLVSLNTADFDDFATHHSLVLLGEHTEGGEVGCCPAARYRAAPAMNAATM
jgi:hypothetical protein